MSNLSLVLTFFFVIAIINQVVANCDRSRYILGAEDVCWTRKVDVGKKLQQAQKSIVNFAKKTLGMESEEKEEPQKCDYYYCIFQEMKLLNPDYDVPCITRTSNWVKRNVIYDQAGPLLERLQSCSEELRVSLESKQHFLADNIGVSERQVIDTDQTSQNRCEIAKEYMKCIAYNQKDYECPVFQYP